MLEGSFIPEKDRSFADVWTILSLNKDIFFYTSHKILKLSGSSIATYNAPSEWTYLGLYKEHLYANDNIKGLMSFENGVWAPLNMPNELPANDPVSAILPIEKDSAIITTLKSGLFIFSKAGIHPLKSANNRLFKDDRVSRAIIVSPEWIALATFGKGVYIIDHRGNLIQSFSRMEGLQNNNALSIFADRENNLWLGLDNGVDMIAYTSAIKQINPSQLDGAGYAAAIFDNRLFIGTANGLFSVVLKSTTDDLSFNQGTFSYVNNTKGQVWKLSEINNKLLIGHHDGAFIIKNNSAEQLSSKHGFWNFLPTSNIFPAAQIIAGNYDGITFFDYLNGQFKESVNVPGFNESSRFVCIDNNDNIWTSHPYRGIHKIYKRVNGTYVINTYTDKKGLPSTLNNFVFKIRNEVIAATEKGIYKFNQHADNFEPAAYYQKLLGNQSIRYMKEDAAGNIWFIHEKMLGVIDFSGKTPVVVYLSELNNKMLSNFEIIFPVDESNVFLGGKKGFFHINYKKYKKNRSNLQAQIRRVNIFGDTDSLLFGGYFKEINENQTQAINDVPKISSYWKMIRFEFSSPLHRYQSILEYSYRLKGFNDNWSDWTKRNEKEYTNLAPGKYTFEIKARNNLGDESLPSSYAFKILPPWYQTTWAYFIYLLIALGGLFYLYKWERKKFGQQRVKYEKEQKELQYIYELERNKTENELIALRNEKLETDILLKNSELASSAMLLVKKGDQFASLKEELEKIMKSSNNPKAIADLKKINKALDEGSGRDKEWENFTKHFDIVHNNFLINLKEIHPTITATESKLSAYLRMNLSSKEIAQLMNISVRGVEISRYRLRKKLELPTGANLFDYLISVQSKT
ncbi:MAG: transcriptional regulator [Sphingobacteriales bacterium]|nr:transcriptional regulator [Sphingobacteriales bacterium]